MYQKVCDRCGELMPSGLAAYMEARTKGYEIRKRGALENAEIHLCDKCQEALKEWLANGKTDQG